MMVIYVNMEMITNVVLHFHYKKVGFYFRNRKLLNYGRRKIPLLEYWQYLKGTYQGFSFFHANSFYMSDLMYLLRTQIIFHNVQ